MFCIGDECPQQGHSMKGGGRSFPLVLIFGIACGGIGYALARPPSPPTESAHLAYLAPPVVTVSPLTD